MNTPICDFVRRYGESAPLRLHMPGHKGRGPLGIEALDITEVSGADVLYHASGIIRESEENAAALFGTARTLYSAEGSSLCIRAMLYLALLRAEGRTRRILAGRNAHRTLMTAAALLDLDVQWLYGSDLISCPVPALALETALAGCRELPAAVFITSPDYLGHTADIAALSAVCRRFRVPLLVDNAHGAYLQFLDRHPIALGADLACDSAHKTLPVLTGGAYLHVGKQAPALFGDQAERALALFASTSPSYLILQSLDACNAYLAGGYRQRLAAFAQKTAALKDALAARGYVLMGDEPLKITLSAKAYGYTGHQLHDELRRRNMECEFSDPDFLTMMLTPDQGEETLERLYDALTAIPRRAPLRDTPPAMPRPQRVMSIRQAMMSPCREIPIADSLGRVLADAYAGCPPAVPLAVCGERIDEAVIRCFRYYGVDRCFAVEEEDGVSALPDRPCR